VSFPSGPKAAWKAGVELLDEAGKTLAEGETRFENDGLVRDHLAFVRLKAFEFDFGPRDDVSNVKRVAVNIEQLAPGDMTGGLRIPIVPPPLQLTMKSDKEKYEVGEEITLHCKVRNVSDRIVNFYPYNQKSFGIKNVDGGLCIPELFQTGEWPTQMVTLRPDEIHEYTLKGKVSKRTGGPLCSHTHQEGKLVNGVKGQYRQVSGIFISFPYHSYYLRDGYGKYRIISCFKDGNRLSDEYTDLPPEKRESFLKDKWQGQLASNSVTIEITK